MYVLGTYVGHDASVAIVGNGRIVHLEKERFTRVKHDGGNVDDLRDEAMRQMGISDDQIVATVDVGPGKDGATWDGDISTPCQVGDDSYMIPHHLAHAAYAFYTSPFEHAAIVTMDGGGDMLRRENSEGPELVAAATGHTTHRFGESVCGPLWLDVPSEQSPGHWWTGMSHELFHESFGAGKIMALGGVRVEGFARITGFSPSVRATICALQDRTTAVFHRFADSAIEGRPQPLVLAGGCALNGIAAESLRQRKDVKAIHIPPAVHDGGLSVGAALYVLHRTLEVPRCRYAPETIAFAGYTDQHLEGVPDIGRIADALSVGRVVCMARGRAESGPRALGHRSILADPRSMRMRDLLNDMKGRQRWRPVAPVSCDVMHGPTHFYMTLIERPSTAILNYSEAQQPAILHDDGTARVQWTPSSGVLGRIVTAFHKRTGTSPVLLNTSFNGPGEAMVNTPDDAIATHERLGDSMLVIGERIYER